MFHHKHLIIAAIVGILITILLWVLSPHDMRPQATIAIVAIWGAVAFSWKKAGEKQKLFAIAFAMTITLISLLAFLSLGNIGLIGR